MKTVVHSCGTIFLAIMLVLPTIGLNPQTMSAMQETSEGVSVVTQDTSDGSTVTAVSVDSEVPEVVPPTEPVVEPIPTEAIVVPTETVAEPTIGPTLEPTTVIEPTSEPTAEPTVSAPLETPTETEPPTTEPSGDDTDPQSTATSTSESTAEVTPTETLSNANNTPGTEADLDATIAVKPDSAAPGEVIQVNGYQFEPGRMYKIDLYDDGSSWIPLANSVSAGEDETFSVSVTIPADTTPGKYAIIATAEVGDGVFRAPFAVVDEAFTPALTLSPVSGTDTKAVVATGTGFAPDEIVNLWWNESPYVVPGGDLVADRDGNFSVEIAVPESLKEGDHAVYARQRNGEIEAKANFELLATPMVETSITLSSTSGRAGSVITVTGKGYTPGETVTIRWGGYVGPVMGTGTASSTGTFSINATIPTTSGLVTRPVWAFDESVRKASQDFTVTALVTPSITLSTTSGRAGTRIAVRGTGFQPGETVTVRWGGYVGPIMGTGKASSTGTIAIAATIPTTSKIQTLPVWAFGTSGQKASAPYRVTAMVVPTITLSTTSGRAGTRIAVRGTGFQPGETVTIRWGGYVGPVMGTGKASSTGTISIAATVPSYANIQTLSVWAFGTSGQKASAPYRVTAWAVPSVQLSITTGRPGTKTTVLGTGYRPNEVVTVRWGSTGGAIIGTVRATSTGTIKIVVAVPVNAATGSHRIYLQSMSATVSVPFTVKERPKANVSLNYTYATHGDVISIQGWNYLPGELVNITFPGNKLVGSIRVKSDGTFSGQFTIPATAATGYNTVTARGSSSGFSAGIRLQVYKNIQVTANPEALRGALVPYTASGFAPGSTVYVYVNDEHIDTIYANSAGQVSDYFFFSTSASYGTHRLILISGDGNVAGETPVRVIVQSAPYIVITASGKQGTRIEYAGWGFGPNEKIVIRDEFGNYVGETISLPDGTYSGYGVVPYYGAGNIGWLYYYARGQSTGRSVRVTFVVTASRWNRETEFVWQTPLADTPYY